jgi:hypothetical protein
MLARLNVEDMDRRMTEGLAKTQNGIIHWITLVLWRKPVGGVECPACSASDWTLLSEVILECSYCGKTYEAAFQQCPVCESINMVNAEHCIVCKEPLSIVSKVLSRHEGDGFQPEFLEHARDRAADLKDKGATASENRMRTLQEIDERRELAQAEAREIQRRSDQRSIRIAFILVALFLVFVVSIVVKYNLF